MKSRPNPEKQRTGHQGLRPQNIYRLLSNNRQSSCLSDGQSVMGILELENWLRQQTLPMLMRQLLKMLPMSYWKQRHLGWLQCLKEWGTIACKDSLYS